MNRERLVKLIEDMTEVLKNLEDCKNVLETDSKSKNVIFIEFGLKQIFVDFFITVENLVSMLLKEYKKFKIGIDMKSALFILKDENIINEEIFIFLNEARLIRNRISHRYKEPSKEELLEFIDVNLENCKRILDIARGYL